MKSVTHCLLSPENMEILVMVGAQGLCTYRSIASYVYFYCWCMTFADYVNLGLSRTPIVSLRLAEIVRRLASLLVFWLLVLQARPNKNS